MSTYVLLLNYTDTGVRNIRYLAEHVRAFRQAVEAAGGRLPHMYMTMGGFDFVAILEAPDDEACATIALGLASVGNFRTVTLKAFGEDSLGAIAERVPSLEDAISRIVEHLD